MLHNKELLQVTDMRSCEETWRQWGPSILSSQEFRSEKPYGNPLPSALWGDMKAVQTFINILMLLSAINGIVGENNKWGINFGDWSLKFSHKPKKLLKYNKFYDPKWAFYVMHQKRHHKPDMNSKSILHISIPPFQNCFEFLIRLQPRPSTKFLS